MNASTRYRSPYRRTFRESRYEAPGRSMRERLIVQCMVCGVALAALLGTLVVGLPFTERVRADVAVRLSADYSDSLPLVPVTNMLERASHFVFGERAAPSAADAPMPPAPAVPPRAPEPAPPSQNPAMSYEGNEHNTFYELGDEERGFIEDIIRQVYEAGNPYTADDAEAEADEHTELDTNDLEAPTPAIAPGSARISSPFGYRTNPVTGRQEKHNGVDMAFNHGTPVVAIQDGVVTEIGYNAYSGNYLRYRTSDGLLVGYAHLYRALVGVGDTVRQGDTVALTGNSGLSTGPHLHVTIWRDGITVDPLTVFAVAN